MARLTNMTPGSSSLLLSALVAVASLSSVSAQRNITALPVIVPLNFVYNTSFSFSTPGRFVTPVQVGNPPQTLSLKFNIESTDLIIRHDGPNVVGSEAFKNLLFKNETSTSFLWMEPSEWLGVGPTDNMTIGSLSNFQTGWNRWDTTETVNLSEEQRREMTTYEISGSFGVHGPQCPVDGKSWFTSLIVGGAVPFRSWGLYFDGGVQETGSPFLDGENPAYSGMLLLGGYQPAEIDGELTAVGNITYNNQLPDSPPGTNSPHILQIDHFAINGQREVAPASFSESWYVLKPESLFSNFSTRAQAAEFARAVGARANDIGNGRTVYTFGNCAAAEDGPTQNVEVCFPAFGGATKRITLPVSSLKIRKDGSCFLSWQEPWDPVQTTTRIVPSRGAFGLSFLRNVYLHADHDAGTYALAPRSLSPATSPNPRSVFAIPNPPKFVLDMCWNKEGTPTGVFQGAYEDNWTNFPPLFQAYYGKTIGPPWILRSGRVIPTGTYALAFMILPGVGILVLLAHTVLSGTKK